MADKIVSGATPKTAPSLCERCQCGTHVRGQNFEELMWCNELRRDITFPVESCTSFVDRAESSLFDMKQIAWSVESRMRGKTGFAATEGGADVVITPPKRRDEERGIPG